MSKRVLVIDDEPDIRDLLGITLKKMGLDVDCAEDVQSARQKLESHPFHLCLSDMKLPDGDGLEIVAYIRDNLPDLPVAIITAHGTTDTAVEALKLGAFDFVSKPVNLTKLRQVVSSAIDLRDAATPTDDNAVLGLLGHSQQMSALREQIGRVSRSQAPVFISGESGSGKELAARSIHYNGHRRNGAFIPVNCGAIPTELMESEFFGYTKGSFSGATGDKQGLFQAASGGTLFLDEVADLPLHMQVKLLRAIQEKAVRPIGSQSEVAVDVRVLSATHKDLMEEVRAKTFRQDLFYRINVIQIDVPPLRDRKEDIEVIAEHILTKLASELGRPVPKLENAALKKLQAYNFPGNVRELENMLERALTLSDGAVIRESDLSVPGYDAQPLPASGAAKRASTSGHDIAGFDSIDHYLEEIEKEILEQTLEQVRWNKTAAAKELGISFRQIRYKLKKLGLDD
ncbi:MAG: sigma-54-dependent transcriptional regulator [bacterium]